MSSAALNVYTINQLIRLKAQFMDPATTTVLTAVAKTGARTLVVRSGIIGAGIPAGALLSVGGDVVTVDTGGGTTTAIPITAPLPNEHQPGEPVGLLVDPTTVSFSTKDPSGVIVVSAATKDGTGQYHYDVTPALHGVWYYRCDGTGTNAAGSEGGFRVEASNFGG